MIHLVLEGVVEQVGYLALGLVLLGVVLGGGAVLAGVWGAGLLL